MNNLKNYIRSKYKTLNYFDVNNITRVINKNNLPFTVADKIASLLFKMKSERVTQIQEDTKLQHKVEQKRLNNIEDEMIALLEEISSLKKSQRYDSSSEISLKIENLYNKKLDLEREKRKVTEKIQNLQRKIQNPEDEYSISLKKAEIAAATRLACAYLGISQNIIFDRDIDITEILKYQDELTNI